MNYEQSINKTYNLDFGDLLVQRGDAVILLKNGNYITYHTEQTLTDNPKYDELSATLVNYANQHSDSLAMGYLWASSDEAIFLAMSSEVDFVVLGSNDNYTHFNVYASRMLQATGQYYYIDDGDALANYPQYDYNTSFTNYTYGSYTSQVTANKKIIYDFSVVKTQNNTNYKSDALILRGENVNLYNNVLQLADFTGNNVTISYGTPYYDYGLMMYDNGYGNGNANGFTNGYDTGYADGLKMGGVDGLSANGFNYLGKAFESVSSILNIEVLPHITLGLCFSIPLVIVLIMTIFRLIKR